MRTGREPGFDVGEAFDAALEAALEAGRDDEALAIARAILERYQETGRERWLVERARELLESESSLVAA